MFGFEPEEAKQLGSAGRFKKRIQKFKDKGKMFPSGQHLLWWWFHNIVAHGAIAVVPCKGTFWLHDWSSKKLNAE
jgi:hypothetical protein